MIRAIEPRATWATSITLVMVVVACASTARGQSSARWELAPYRVEVALVLDDLPELDAVGRAASRRALATRLEQHSGAAWELTVVDESAASPWAEWVRRPTTSLPAGVAPIVVDKRLVVLVERGASGWRVVACEWDARTERRGPREVVELRQWPRLVETCAEVVREAFVPLAWVDTVEQDVVRLRLRASGLFDDPAHLAAWRVGDVFEPLVRYEDRDGATRRVVGLDWTLLRVETLQGGAAQSRLYSGYRAPLAGRRRGRVETIARRVRPEGHATRLELVSREDERRTLAGYELLAQLPPARETQLLGTTDERGRLTLPPREQGFRVLHVRHGTDVQARLPIVVGWQPAVRVVLADDDWRLEVEGIVHGLQEQVVDSTVRRRVRIDEFRELIEQGDLAAAERTLQTLRDLHRTASWSEQIRSLRTRFVHPDAAQQAKITRLLDDTERVLATALDARVLPELEAELALARRQRGSP